MARGQCLTCRSGTLRLTGGMIIYLDKLKSLDQYQMAIKSIEANEMFNETITISGKSYKISEYFTKDGNAYSYYHMVEGSMHYFAKLKSTEGIVLTLKYLASDEVESTISNWIKMETTKRIKFKLEDIKDEK
jgi:phosphoribosylformylglycinamidine (FGAM) synthase-like amidotransferase family enzyme